MSNKKHKQSRWGHRNSMQHNIFHFKRHKHEFKLKSARICHVIIERTLEKNMQEKARERRRHHRLKIDLMGSIIRNMNGVPMLRFFFSLFLLFHLRDRFNARKCLSRQNSFIRAHLFLQPYRRRCTLMSFISHPNTPATPTIHSHCRHFTTWGNHFEIGVLIKKCENTNERVMHASDNFIHITDFAGCAINIHQGPSFRYRILPIIWNVVTKFLVFVGLTNHIVFLFAVVVFINKRMWVLSFGHCAKKRQILF